MRPEYYMMSGWRIIYPIFGFMMMIFFIFMMTRRAGYWSNRRGSWRRDSEQRYSESALEILNKRYASGEISKEEFDQMKHDI